MLLVGAMSLYETFHKSRDTLGKNKGVEAFAMALNRADAINFKEIPFSASQNKSKDTVCQEQLEVIIQILVVGHQSQK